MAIDGCVDNVKVCGFIAKFYALAAAVSKRNRDSDG